MSYQNISAVITAEDKAAVQAAIQTIKAKLPFLVNLNPQERKKLRKLGAVRTSYVQDVYQASVNNPNAIPSDINLAEFAKDIALQKDMQDVVSWLMPLWEGIEITAMAIGSELMNQSDACYGYLKVAAQKSNNQALGETVKKIAAQLKHAKAAAKGNSTPQ